MKQSCYFAKVCDRIKRLQGSIFLHYNLVYMNEAGLQFCVKKAPNLFQDVGDYFFNIPGRYGEVLTSRENS